MNRSARIQSARVWLKKYSGKYIASGYRRHFGVDWMCAFKELEILGIKIESDYKRRVLRSVEEQRLKTEWKKIEKEELRAELFDKDEDFIYIVDYTSGGAPIGIRRDELKNEKDVSDTD